LKPKFAQVPEQSGFTYGVYLVAAEHLQPQLQGVALTVQVTVVVNRYMHIHMSLYVYALTQCMYIHLFSYTYACMCLPIHPNPRARGHVLTLEAKANEQLGRGRGLILYPAYMASWLFASFPPRVYPNRRRVSVVGPRSHLISGL